MGVGLFSMSSSSTRELVHGIAHDVEMQIDPEYERFSGSARDISVKLSLASTAGAILTVAMIVFGYTAEGKKGAVLTFGVIVTGWASYNGYHVSKNLDAASQNYTTYFMSNVLNLRTLITDLRTNTFMAEGLIDILMTRYLVRNQSR